MISAKLHALAVLTRNAQPETVFRNMPHLLTVISPHGFGHLAQTAPVVNALRRRVANVDLTIRATFPQALIAKYFEGEFRYVAQAADFGMVMASALAVLVEESALRYSDFHRQWDHHVALEAQRLQALAPDLILANIPYLTLAGAQRAGITAIAMCSLTWADIYWHYCSSRPEAPSIRKQMLDAYNSAAQFLQPQPAMPMPDILRVRPIGPLARIGSDRRDIITRHLGIDRESRLVLVAFGGIEMRLPVETWPVIPGQYWLVPAAWQVRHPQAVVVEQLPVAHIDLLRSCDALIGKPGYGTFTEAACNGVPVLYVTRGDWPEEPCLVEWLRQHGRVLQVRRAALESDEVMDSLDRLWELPAPPRPQPNGIDEAAEILCGYLTKNISPRSQVSGRKS